ncbi:hypothetical protein ACFXJ8_23050 [Nonomuraea sp. NPDC059194]|uniref:hypothetical protein n=1 Tax=Nonomuraea sp. NPDC059194 TaxID=3346764 RepID=UPI0036A63185
MTEHRHAEDELQVPPPRADTTRDDPDATDDAADRDFQATAETRDERGEQEWQGHPRDDTRQDDRMAQARATEEGMAGEAVRRPMTDAEPEIQQGDTGYHDPYETRPSDDVLATAPGATAPGDTAMRDTGMTGAETRDAGMADAGTATAAPPQPRAEQGGFVLDQDAEQLRDRWREVQGGFVDEPRQSVERADALVGELLSTLTSEADQLRDRWRNSSESDTEQLRNAMREYHSMLDQLLTLTTAGR